MTRKGPYGLKTSSKPPESIGGRIAAIRKAWGWTQGDLAARLRLKTAAVSAWERGKAAPTGTSLLSLAALLNTTPEALLEGSTFTIPDLPLGVAEPDWAIYRLPPVGKKDAVLVVEAGVTAHAVGPKDLRRVAQEALQAGAPVWLVIGPPEGQSPV
jgi:transcriptional regulator with XRE-family HTH domain